MAEVAKVVDLDPALTSRQRGLYARLPPVILAVNKKQKIIMATLLAIFFDRATDALFHAADQSNEHKSLKAFDDLRVFREQQASFTQQFVGGIDAAYAELLAAQDNQKEAIPENLSLQVLIDEHVNECLANNNVQFASINTRFGFILEKTINKENPLGPEVIGTIFSQQLLRLPLTEESLTIVIPVFNVTFFDHLNNIYNAAEEQLDQLNIPKAKEIDNHFASQYLTKLSKRNKRVTSELDKETVNIIDSVLGHNAAQEIISRRDLLKILDVAQREVNQTTTTCAPSDVLKQIQTTQKQLNINGVFASYDSELIKLVTVMFDLVTRNKNLDDVIKGYLIRLLVPVMKVSLVDKTFFSSNNHPARSLLNELVVCGLGWQHSQDKNLQLGVVQDINAITHSIAQNFCSDPIVFNQAFKKLRKTQAEEEKQLSILSARLSTSSEGRTKASDADTLAKTAIKNTLEQSMAAPIVSVFATQLWQNTLAVIAIKHSVHSKEWKEYTSLLDELCQLATPCMNTADKIARSYQIPALIPKLQQGLSLCAHNAFDAAEIFEEIHHTLCLCLKGETAAEAFTLKNRHAKETPTPGSLELAVENINADVSPPATPKTEKRIRSLTKNEEPTETLDNLADDHTDTPRAKEGISSDAPPLQGNESSVDDLLKTQIERFARGALFDYNEPSGGTIRCRLAAVIKQTNHYIFINRNGIKVVELSIDGMILAIKSEQLKPIEHGMVFDKALEAVVTGLRRNTNTLIGDRRV